VTAPRGSDYGRVARALEFLSAHRAEQPALERVARHVGLSPFHFQRLFLKWAGVTPKEYLQALTLEDAKALLERDRAVLTTAIELGLSGPSRLHDLFVSVEKTTPGEFKARGRGLDVAWTVQPTPFGDALFAATERGLARLAFVGEAGAPRELRASWPEARFQRADARLRPTVEEVRRRMNGLPPGSRLGLALQGSSLRLKVWQALVAVPAARLVSYGALARAVGEPRAVRPVASCVAENPIAYLIPCHRVIRSDGHLGGYRFGSDRKRALLAAERVRADSQEAVA
jgi:AraC family transcriptional regulator of adaptative response/methylated-DNA-[protein]-cysteine methyltransferase